MQPLANDCDTQDRSPVDSTAELERADSKETAQVSTTLRPRPISRVARAALIRFLLADADTNAGSYVARYRAGRGAE